MKDEIRKDHFEKKEKNNITAVKNNKTKKENMIPEKSFYSLRRNILIFFTFGLVLFLFLKVIGIRNSEIFISKAEEISASKMALESRNIYNTSSNGNDEKMLRIQEINENHLVPMLTYHHFCEEITTDLLGTAVTPQEFEDQIVYLKQNGYTAISFKELNQFLEGKFTLPQKPYILTMDDGYSSVYDKAFPILKRLGIKAVSFTVISNVGLTLGNYPHYTWEQAKEMEESGIFEVFSHGNTHVDHTKMTKEDLIRNITLDEYELEKHLGKKGVKVFAYPFGEYSQTTVDVFDSMNYIHLSTIKKNAINSKYLIYGRITVYHGDKGDALVKLLDRWRSGEFVYDTKYQ